MDRVTQLRAVAGGSKDSSFDSSTAQSEAYLTANESESSKYFSLSEEDSTFDINPVKDVSLNSAADPEKNITEADQLIANLSPISKENELLESYKFGKQIEAANILSGGVDIFDDNENSYDEGGLVIDDNVMDTEDKSNPEPKTVSSPRASIEKEDDMTMVDNGTEASDVESKDTEIVLQIDGKNVNAINIGNGLYLYRKEGQEELAAVQIIDDDQQQPSFKFLKVRENAEGNLEVYEEIEIEVPKETPTKDGKQVAKKPSLPTNEKSIVNPEVKEVQAVESQPSSSAEISPAKPEIKQNPLDKEITVEPRMDNFTNKLNKLNETRKSPVIHSTPNKEGIPLTKTMVDQQLHPNRHLDKVKTIEVHTDITKQKLLDIQPTKNKKTSPENVIHVAASSSEQSVEATAKKIENKADKAIDTQILASPILKLNEVEKSEDLSTQTTQKCDEIKLTNSKQSMRIATKTNESETEHSTEANESKVNHSSEHPKLDNKSQDQDLKNKGVLSKTDTLLKPESDVTKSSNVFNEINLGKNLINEEAQVPAETTLIRNETFELKEEKALTNATKATVENPKSNTTVIEVEDTCKIAKDIKFVDKITDFDLPQSKDENYGKICEIKSPVKGESMKAVESASTKVTKTHVPIQCMPQVDHQIKITTGEDVLDCAKPIQICTRPEEKHNLTKSVDVENKETNNSGLVKIEHIKKYPKLAQKDTITTPSLKEHGISSSKIVETELYTALHCNKLNTIPNLFEDKVAQGIAEKPKNSMKVNLEEIKASSKTNTKCAPLNFTLESKVPPTLITSKPPSHMNDNKIMVPQKSAQVEPPKFMLQNVSAKPISQLGFNPILKSESSQPFPEKKLDISKVASTKTNLMPVTVRSLPDSKMNIKVDDVKASSNFEKKPNNNNHAGVPFGKWTEANRQDFLNKIRESKVPTNPLTNNKQIKQPNDLNKREFLQKIDVHRLNTYTTAKLNERRVAPKLDVKTETKIIVNKPVTRDVTLPVKVETASKACFAVASKPGIIVTKAEITKPCLQPVVVAKSNITATHDSTQQKRNQDLIDKTIEGIINRVITTHPEDLTPSTSQVIPTERKNDVKLIGSRSLGQQLENKNPASLDAIEMKMNELHGIPFIERPPHQLPRPLNHEVKTYSKADIPNKIKVTTASSISTSYLPKNVKQNIIDVDSEEEVIEQEPVTGDMDMHTRRNITKISTQLSVSQNSAATTTHNIETIITEKDFDKFARRNSITYEDHLTVKYQATEGHAAHKIEEKVPPQTKKYSRNELLLAEAKVKSDQKQQHRINHPAKIVAKPVSDDAQNKLYQSKLQIAYQSALTAKRKTEPPPALLHEDKPVKVMLVDESSGLTPGQLNVQVKELSPKKKNSDPVNIITTTNVSNDSDLIEIVESIKQQDDNKTKGKHQRKQVLTPVETPELELIEPYDLGLADSPKKKRRTVEPSFDVTPENVVPLKTYLLGRNKLAEEIVSPPQDLSKSQSIPNKPANVTDTATAIDNLVKAAELLETQSENINRSTVSVNSEDSQTTPLKRGRGRPRKYPLGESPSDKSKIESQQKRLRLIDAKPPKASTPSDEDTSDDELIRENWTMGKINAKIVCPICKKLFRSENVVFKHVKHCTGPSPNRSESDNLSRKSIQSQESETKSVDSKFDDVDYEPPEERKPKKLTPKKRQSKDAVSESSRDVDDVIVIEDTPKQKPKPHESIISRNTKPLSKDSLACDICGKTFRQLSYLVSHKWQHKREESKKVDDVTEVAAKSVFCCEVCKKEFRKLHHLVQHRLIHNPTTTFIRSSRKSSSENIEQKSKNFECSKPSDDPSAGFRCEPCDKSFRKLHHLVEHRETHDGQNRQKSIPAAPAVPPEDKISDPPPQCDICKKTFRKLHHLIEHKEQHLETVSEKSDDKSVKSSLSTKDIIHECRLCYMVFPNEHSLNKHSVFCQRKKKPAVTKPPQPGDEEVTIVIEDSEPVQKQIVVDTPIPATENNLVQPKDISPGPPPIKPNSSSTVKEIEIVTIPEKVSTKQITSKVHEVALINATDNQRNAISKDDDLKAVIETPPKCKRTEGKEIEMPAKAKKVEDKVKQTPIVKAVSKRKSPIKEKVAVIKRPKSTNIPLAAIKEGHSHPESSDDDDEVRYMLNPVYKCEQSKLFMEVRAKKRNSLQIEKPNREAIKRRTSLQQPPKIPRLKSQSIEDRAVSTKTTAFTKNALKMNKPEPAPSTDSEDSDVKYSFPETVTDESGTSDPAETKKVLEVKRKSITNKRKSLTGIAKRKSLGKPIVHKKEISQAPVKPIVLPNKEKLPVPVKPIVLPNKEKLPVPVKPIVVHKKEKSPAPVKPIVVHKKEKSPAPVKIIKRRTLGVEHRCDCGQLFSSAALLSRHTTLSHTPPRIRRRRSPPPPPARAQTSKRKSADTTEQAKSAKKTTAGQSVTDKSPRLKRSSKKDEPTKSGSIKSRVAHKGVPVPEKMKKLFEKINKVK